MSTTFSYQILTCVEAVYMGTAKPSELDKSNRWQVLFTSFVNTPQKVFSPDLASEFVGDTVTVKLEQSALEAILPILKLKSFYRLVLGIRDWSMNGRSGMSFRLVDISPITVEESLFNRYIGKLKDVSIDSSIADQDSAESSLVAAESLQKFLA